MGLTRYQGGLFDDRTLAMYRELERITPFDFFLSQGGFNPDGVAASAGTHDRAAVDIGAAWLTPDQRWELCKNGRKVGFAMYIRTPAQGFSWHLHGVPINGDLSIGARAQVVQYLSVPHLNGLAGRGPDDGPTGYYDMTWEKYSGSSAYRPPINTDGSGGTTTTKDWYENMDQAAKDALLSVFIRALTEWSRGEGVSGSGDRSKNGVGENTVATHELESTLVGGNSSLLAEQRKTNDLLSQLVGKLSA